MFHIKYQHRLITNELTPQNNLLEYKSKTTGVLVVYININSTITQPVKASLVRNGLTVKTCSLYTGVNYFWILCNKEDLISISLPNKSSYSELAILQYPIEEHYFLVGENVQNIYFYLDYNNSSFVTPAITRIAEYNYAIEKSPCDGLVVVQLTPTQIRDYTNWHSLLIGGGNNHVQQGFLVNGVNTVCGFCSIDDEIQYRYSRSVNGPVQFIFIPFKASLFEQKVARFIDLLLIRIYEKLGISDLYNEFEDYKVRIKRLEDRYASLSGNNSGGLPPDTPDNDNKNDSSNTTTDTFSNIPFVVTLTLDDVPSLDNDYLEKQILASLPPNGILVIKDSTNDKVHIYQKVLNSNKTSYELLKFQNNTNDLCFLEYPTKEYFQYRADALNENGILVVRSRDNHSIPSVTLVHNINAKRNPQEILDMLSDRGLALVTDSNSRKSVYQRISGQLIEASYVNNSKQSSLLYIEHPTDKEFQQTLNRLNNYGVIVVYRNIGE